MLPAIDQFDPFNVLIPLFILLGALFLSRSYFNGRSGTRLKGPPSNSFLFGRLRDIHTSNDRASVYKRWAKEYGHVFEIPIQFGKRNVILCDPKAIAHVFSKDTFTYFTLPFVKAFRKAMAGRSMLDEEGEEHRRLRRILSPAFSYPALRGITHVFYDAAYKAKSSWEVLLMSSDEVIFDVQEWMDRITLDSIGISGFSYDFKALEGSQSAFTQALDSFNEDSVENARLFMFIGLAFPQILYLPTRRTRLFKQMRQEAYNIGAQLLEKSQKVMEGSNVNDRSILGLLFRGQSADANSRLRLVEEEVAPQNLFLVAGYLTTSISLSWSLVELSRYPEVQHKLRQELRKFTNNDPTWDQLTSGLPYLDSVALETLRLHPTVEDIARIATADDVIPLGAPIETATGQTVDSVIVPKGTAVTVPASFINRNETFWGPDADSFIPERWLKEEPFMPKDIHGYRHLLTFSDGPRICPGRVFALTEFKAVLSVLIRNFSFEPLHGPDTEVGIHITLLPRPKIAGEKGSALPMRVRRIVE